MIMDAVSAHRWGVLSLDAVKAHIQEQRGVTEPGAREPASGDHVVLSFSEQLPTLKQAEDLLIGEAMRRAKGNQAIAALSLGITRQALNRRLRLAGK
jgi:transcriptional regulator with PAS, ATPase and Fis domain